MTSRSSSGSPALCARSSDVDPIRSRRRGFPSDTGQAGAPFWMVEKEVVVALRAPQRQPHRAGIDQLEVAKERANLVQRARLQRVRRARVQRLVLAAAVGVAF